ncbi:hypothetical protein, partial [Mediterraneibacter gnavus]|uniref:hypothetical protein n=1 Tax=Mediterraneibacter gnavus TaxID=33038 RepID=UPI001A9AFB92
DSFMPGSLLFCMKSKKSVCYSVADNNYRRIGNKVMADETRKTREKMDLILMDIIKGWDGYEL